MKKTNKKYLIYLLILILIILLTACTSKVDLDTGLGENIEVVDSMGRKVVINGPVEKVATFYPLAGHVVTMLDRNMNIVALSQGLKRDVLLAELNPSIEDAVIAGSGREINIETLMEQSPDLVIITNNMWENEGEVLKLDNSQIPYIVVDYKNMEEQQKAIEIIGLAVGREEKARKYNKYYEEAIELVENRVKNLNEEEKLRVFHSTNEAARTENKDTISYDWVKTIGLKNVIEEEKLNFFENSKYFASLEQIYIWDPDVFLVHDKDIEEYIKTDEKWEGLEAVKNNKVYTLPIGISRWGHVSSLEIPLALLWTGKTFYPENFKDIEIKEEVKKYYREFFDYNLNEEEIERILNAQDMRKERKN